MNKMRKGLAMLAAAVLICQSMAVTALAARFDLGSGAEAPTGVAGEKDLFSYTVSAPITEDKTISITNYVESEDDVVLYQSDAAPVGGGAECSPEHHDHL